MSEYTFNIDGGYLEGLVRGFKGGILSQSDYMNLVQCDTLEGMFIRKRRIKYIQIIFLNIYFHVHYITNIYI